MLIPFFFLLRKRGLDVSLNEWVTLMEGLQKGLHGSSLTGFYYLCRSITVKNEADFDKFDQAFLEFFQDVSLGGELPEEFMEWLNKPLGDLEEVRKDLSLLGLPGESMDEILERIRARLKDQDAEHNGGNKWIGTHGYSPHGNSGWHPHGVRIGGESMYHTARSVAGERKYRDFRKDNTLDTRGFQVALKTLRNLSVQADTSEEELDIDGTIRDTADNAGRLKIRTRPPRKSTIKILLLMDSGGSIQYYSRLCSALFQAVTKSRHFKELHTYYFHNMIYDRVYTEPSLLNRTAVPIDWIMANFDSSYRVIIVGDAMMDTYELYDRSYDWRERRYSDRTGMDCLRALVHRYPFLIWLNPEPRPYGGYWGRSYLEIEKEVPMFRLSEEGIEQGMHRLMAR